MSKEVFDFNGGLKRKLVIAFIVGAVLLAVGAMLPSGGHGEAEGDHTELASADDHGSDHATSEKSEGDHHEAEASHGESDGHAVEGDHGGGHEKSWFDRFKVDFWINNIYFTGLALIGLFFFAIQYAAQAGWSAYIIRIPLSMAHWILPAGVLMIATFLLFSHDIFHWTHADLYPEFLEDGSINTHFDALIAGKSGFFYLLSEPGTFPVFFVLRMVVFFAAWYFLFKKLRDLSNLEDQMGGDSYWYKLRRYSVAFLLVFAVSSSVSAWDWVMSIDVHWFSTMFGWYVFASWFVAGLALITLITVLLKEAGYLTQVTANHLHDLGKFVFAFSIFWTYIWFSQFLLIYYANIPEESVYFVERMISDKYAPVFFVNLIMNFFFPFLCLITRDAKRLNVFLKIACIVIILGHWVDFYLMITPGTLGESGSFGLTEIGMYLMFGAAFLFVVMKALSSYALVPKNHPMLEEAKHHHI
ncbi:quinol:cytochrome C oxidoreductase [Roseivirga misakiensis]|uniref:Quinol:cytochrome C oxidoreductase n=1 Tax=Roseivirga misakiensis TaxID=1563681 RepID=A0A1E5T1Q2_9BACT|nr:quinol:cytochrome C oxidoreductase [Roseivirga misakiensis]OEK05304.1 quinol:cytochrome C oxidoreductase [Roseivirga misakiensis]